VEICGSIIVFEKTNESTYGQADVYVYEYEYV